MIFKQNLTEIYYYCPVKGTFDINNNIIFKELFSSILTGIKFNFKSKKFYKIPQNAAKLNKCYNMNKFVMPFDYPSLF